MKKILFGIAIFVLGLGMQGGLVRAETLNANVKALDAAEVAAIQKQINVLKATVVELQAQIALRRSLQQVLGILTVLVQEVRSTLKNPNLATQEKMAIGNRLAGVSGQLLSLRDVLGVPAPLKSIAVARPASQMNMQPVVAKKPEVVKQSEKPIAAVSKANEPVETATAPEETSKEAQTASISGKFGGWRSFVVVLVLAGFGAFVWWLRRDEKEVQEVQVFPQP